MGRAVGHFEGGQFDRALDSLPKEGAFDSAFLEGAERGTIATSDFDSVKIRTRTR